jgi:hypothetical protein
MDIVVDMIITCNDTNNKIHVHRRLQCVKQLVHNAWHALV